MGSSAFKLGLPSDIPWRRVCVSEDMLDSQICDATFPPKWHSSIAVFKYQPEDEFQEYPDYDVAYLKVSVSITGYQPRDQEIEGQILWDQLNPQVIREVQSLLNEYHPCTGALVQVEVAPRNAEDVDVKEYPFFLDFEPKKRELYELATDTRQLMSRSLHKLNVGKSGMNTESLEVLDIDMGGSWNAGANVSVAGVGVGVKGGGSHQGQWGTKAVGSNVSGVVQSIDHSNEKREAHSFTTQISQLHHLLDSYHLGTNRALFLMEPRPHVLQQESGFVQGPRPLDGIQEFFLIVAKPKHQEDFCISVRLDTAHLTELDLMEHEYRQDSLNLSVAVAPPEPSDPQAAFSGYRYTPVYFGPKIGERRYKCYTKTAQSTETYIASDRKPGFLIDVSNQGGYQIVTKSAHSGSYRVEVPPNGETLTAHVDATSHKCFNDGGTVCLDCPDTIGVNSAHSTLSLLIHLKSRKPIRKVGTQKVLLVATRGLCCCETRSLTTRTSGIIGMAPLEELVRQDGLKYGLTRAYSGTTFVPQDEAQGTSTEVVSEGITINEANILSKICKAQLQKMTAGSQGREPSPYILHDFFFTQLEAKLRTSHATQQRLAENVEGERIQLVERGQLEEYYNLSFAALTNRDIVGLSVGELAKATGLSHTQAAELRLEALGVVLAPTESF